MGAVVRREGWAWVGVRGKSEKELAKSCAKSHAGNAPPRRSFPPPLPCSSTSMGAPSVTFFICDKCGKVCKTLRGLTQHKYVHRALPQLGDPQNFHREFHPLLNGRIYFYLLISMLTVFQKDYPVITAAVFSHWERRRCHLHHSRTTTGPHSHRERGSNLPTSCTSRRTSPKASSTISWTFGVLHSYPMEISPPSPVIETSTPRSTPSIWGTSHGDHTQPSISGSAPRMVRCQNGWEPSTKSGFATPDRSFTTFSQTLSLSPALTTCHTRISRMESDNTMTS